LPPASTTQVPVQPRARSTHAASPGHPPHRPAAHAAAHPGLAGGVAAGRVAVRTPSGKAAGPKVATGGGGQAGESDPLARWKAASAAAVGAVPEPDLEDAAAAPAKLGEHAQAVEDSRRSARPDFAKEVKATVAAAPDQPPREKILDTGPADAALGAVEAAGAGKLADQTFPPPQQMPVHQGAPASIGPPPVLAAAKPGPALGAAGPFSAAATPLDPKADEVRGKVASVALTTAAPGAAEPVILHDKGAASLSPPSPDQGQQIGDVLARVKVQVGNYAESFVRAGAATLDPSGSVDGFKTLADAKKGEQEAAISTEIDGVAAAAGVSAADLSAKVDHLKVQATQQGATTAAALATKGDTTAAAVKARGDEELNAVAGAKEAIVHEVDQRQEAAGGAPSPAVIAAKRDSYLERVESTKAAGAAAYRAASENRAAELDRAGTEQKGRYRQQARIESERIKGLYQGEYARIESTPVLDWAEQQALEVDAIVARLKKTSNAEVQRLQDGIRTATVTARNQIRDWAASKEGRQRNWWDQLMDMFKDWASQSKADTKAWEAQRNAQTRDTVSADFDMLVKMRDEMAAGNKQAVLDQMAKLSKEQKAVLTAFLHSGGKDPVGAVAVGLIERLKARRVPEISKALEEEAINSLGWEDLNALGRAQNPGFDAGVIVRDVRGSVKGWGTDEKRLFKALQGRTPLQIAAMKKAYAATYPGRNMEEDVNDDVSGSEAERAQALMTGDPTAGAVATLNDAMSGAGTDEALIMQTLRGKTPAERDAIMDKYQETYGVDLRSRMADDMDGNDLDQANALLAGDTAKADAIALNEAMSGVGTDEDAIHAVYSQVRDEVESQARAKGMTTAEVEAEIKRRTAAIKERYGNKYAGGDQGKLEADFQDELSGGELKLAIAEQSVDQSGMDAAKIQIEHEGFYADDDKINAVLRNQYDRAKKDEIRDLQVKFDEDPANRTLSAADRKAKWKKIQSDAETTIAEKAKKNMAGLESRYDAENPEWGPGAFQSVISLEMSGYSQEEARTLISQGGKLSDAQEIKYAVFGAGTDEETIKKTLKGKSKEEIEQLKRDYKALTGNDLKEDLEGDLSGRDKADANLMLQGTGTPEEQLAYLRARKDWELNKGTGIVGGLFDDEESDVLESTTVKAGSAYDDYQKLRSQYGEEDPRTQAAKERFERFSEYGDKDVEEHRAALDSITDTIATGAAIVAGIAVTALTAGAAGPAVIAAAAALGTTTTVVGAIAGAVAATAASMLTKQLMKGEAYGGEDIVVDLANGAVNVIVAGATAGLGEIALQAILKTPAFAIIAEAAESGVLGRVTSKAVASGIEGAIAGLPSGMAAAIMDENTWKSGNPLGVILEAGASGAAEGAKMGAAMGGVMHGATEAYGAVHGPNAPEGAPSGSKSGTTEGSITEPIAHGDTDVGTGTTDAGAGPGSHEAPAGAAEIEPRPTGNEASAGHGDVDVATGAPASEPTPGQHESGPGPADPLESKAAATEPDRVPSAATEATQPSGSTTQDAEIMLMPEETVMQAPDPKDPAGTQEMYRNSIAEDPLREVAVYRNTETGEYIVIQGNESTVQVASGEAPRDGGNVQRWKEILDGRPDVGRWELDAHSHPSNPATGVVEPVNQWPSGGNGDMGAIANEAQASGKPRSSRIDYTTTEGAGHTDFGFDPTQEKPYWVDRPDGNGGRVVDRFKTMESYHDFMENTLGAPQGDVPDHLSGTSPRAAEVEPTPLSAGNDGVPASPDSVPGADQVSAAESPTTADATPGPAETESVAEKKGRVEAQQEVVKEKHLAADNARQRAVADEARLTEAKTALAGAQERLAAVETQAKEGSTSPDTPHKAVEKAKKAVERARGAVDEAQARQQRSEQWAADRAAALHTSTEHLKNVENWVANPEEAPRLSGPDEEYDPKVHRRPNNTDFPDTEPAAVDRHSGVATDPDARIGVFQEEVRGDLKTQHDELVKILNDPATTQQQKAAAGHVYERLLAGDLTEGTDVLRLVNEAAEKTRISDHGAHEFTVEGTISDGKLDQLWRDLIGNGDHALLTVPTLDAASEARLAKVAAIYEEVTGRRPRISVRETVKTPPKPSPSPTP